MGLLARYREHRKVIGTPILSLEIDAFASPCQFQEFYSLFDSTSALVAADLRTVTKGLSGGGTPASS